MESFLILGVRSSLALVLLAPLVVNAPPLPHSFFPFVVGKALFTRTLIEIAFGLWVVLAIRSPEHRVSRSWVLGIFAIYVGVALLASLFSVSPQRSLWSTYERMQGFVDLAHWFVFTVVVASVFRSWPDWRSLLNFNLAVSVILGVMGLAQALDITILSYLRPTGRIGITLGNPTYVGAYMMVSVMIALGLLARSYQRAAEPARSVSRGTRRGRGRRRAALDQVGGVPIAWWRAFWIATIVLDVVIMFLSGSRGAVIGLAAGLLAFAAGYAIWGQVPRGRLISRLLIGSLLMLGLVFALVRNTEAFRSLVSPSVTLSRMAKAGLDDESIKGRLNAAKVGLQGVAERPLLGWGPENFTIAYDRHVTGDIVASITFSFDQAHNKPVEELVTKGALGVAGYLAVWGALFWVVARRTRRDGAQEQIFTLFVGAALASYFVQNLFLFDTPGTVGQCMLLLAYVAYLETAPATGVEPEAGARVVVGEPGKPPSVRSAPAFLRISLAWLQGALRPATLRARRTEALEAPLVPILQLAIAALFVGVAIYFFSFRPYQGSTLILGTVNREISWTERLGFFGDSIDAFPALGNYPRLVMFNQLTTNWHTLTPQEAATALAIAEQQGREAMKGEPQEWRIHATLASLYHRAASSDPAYLEKAGELVDQVAELAPERLETQRLKARQRMLEKDFDGALESIDTFVGMYPEAARHLNGLRDEISKAAED